MTKWLLIGGVLLLVSGISIWYWLSLRPSLGDAEFVLAPQVQIPIAKIPEQGNLELDNIHGATPPQIKRSWGEGGYVLAAVSLGRHVQYCFDSMQVKVLSGPKMADVGHSDPVYGYGSAYGSSCHSIGRRFRLPDGEEAYLQISGGTSEIPSDAEIIVVRSWPNTKDKLVAIEIDRDIRKVANWLVNVGILTILLSGFLFVWRRLNRRAPVDVLS